MKRWRELDDNDDNEVVSVLLMKMSRDNDRQTGTTRDVCVGGWGVGVWGSVSIPGLLCILTITLVIRGPQCQIVSQ